MILDELFDAAADFDTDALATLMHPEVRFQEMPNLIAPRGNEYGFEEALAGFRKGREMLARKATTCVHASATATRSRRA